MFTLALMPSLAVAAPQSHLRFYFPPQTATFTCQFGNRSLAMPLVDEHHLASFANALAIAGEPALLAPRIDGARIVRFTWLRSFHAPIVIRLTVAKRGDARVDAVTLSGLGGYDYGAVKARISKSVPRKDAMALLTQADPKDLIPAKPFCGLPGLDGAEWLIERNDGTGAYFAERFSPRSGPIRDIGIALLRLSGLEPRAEETY